MVSAVMCAIGLALLLVPLVADAADNQKRPKLDLGLKVDVGAGIPKGENLQRPKEQKEKIESSQTPTDVAWTVVRVQHGKAFMRGPSGATATSALEAIPAGGSPFTTEKFTTVVRVKCPQKVTASIELSVLDGRSNEMMSGGGTLYYRGEKTDEADYTLDWDPTPVRGPGDYQLLVRVAGNVLGTFPMKIVDKNAARGDAGR